MTKKELSALKRLRDLANFKDASFNDCTQQNPITLKTDADTFIKERTRVFRQSWILPIIEALIKKYDYKLNGVGEQPKGYNPVTKGYRW